MYKNKKILGLIAAKSSQIVIGGRQIGKNQPAFIVAEAGVNHNGDIKLAKYLIDVAAKSGADAVKFQTYKTEELVTMNAPQPKYQKRNSRAANQFEMLQRLELSESEFRELFNYCDRKKILFLATPFDYQSLLFLDRLGVPAFKVSSGDLTNLPFLAKVAGCGKPTILSTGMSDLLEIKAAVRAFFAAGNKKLILMHCTSCYPTEYADVNLRAMAVIRQTFDLPVGYSDHTIGAEVAIAAVALGACVIEKHFTLDKNLPGPDHKASNEPEEFERLVRSIKNLERSLGDGIKTVRKCELGVKLSARKSVVVLHDLPKGTNLKAEMLAIKRPGNGIEPKYFSRLIGKCLKQAVKGDTVLTWEKLL